MNHQTFVRAAAGVLVTAAMSAAAFAQATQPQPPVMTDTAPLPASDRDSIGAVVLMDQPVLAQRQAMAQAQARTGVDTTALGAGPNRIMRRAQTQDEIEFQRALDAALRQQDAETPR
jgi:hypothetical protein